MRRPIAVEGTVSTDGREILPGALTWGDEPIPVIPMGGDVLLGKATNLRREVDGFCCGHALDRHGSHGCMVEMGDNGSGSVADTVFCRCRLNPSER